MQKKQSRDEGYNITRASDREPEQNLGMLEDSIRILRDSARHAAEKPDFFWKRQHAAIMAALSKPVPEVKRRPAFLWAPAALGIILCLLLFVENSKAPTPDFAAGSDQELLIEVERALNRTNPEAFDPVIPDEEDAQIKASGPR